jgi:predicted HTH domain antitoxin
VLDLPEDLAQQLDSTDEAVARRVLEALVLRLFQEGAISSGQGAELLRVGKEAFQRLLVERNVPFFDQAPDELLADVQAALEASRAAASQRRLSATRARRSRSAG